MNYIELINRYWQEVDVKGFTPTETDIYFRLLDICNRLGWENPFSLSNPRAVALMAVTENTLAAGRDKLVMKGLIGFKKGSRRKDAPIYCFPENIDGEWVFPEGFTSNIAPKPAAKQGAKTGVKPEANDDFAASFTSNIAPKPAAYNKTKTINSDVSDDVAPVQASLDFGKEKNSKRKSQPKEPPTPPTREEVMEYFRANAADRLQDWETSANLFYDSYNATGWIDNNGRYVRNWDSAANKWIFYREDQEKKGTKNEDRQTDRFSERRGAEPANPKRKGFKGTFQA